MYPARSTVLSCYLSFFKLNNFSAEGPKPAEAQNLFFATNLLGDLSKEGFFNYWRDPPFRGVLEVNLLIAFRLIAVPVSQLIVELI